MNRYTNLLAIIAGLLVTLYLGLVASGHKRFIVWEQITSSYKRTLLQNPEYYCNSLLEQQVRSVTKYIKISQYKTDDIQIENCISNIVWPGQYKTDDIQIENRISNIVWPGQYKALHEGSFSHMIRNILLGPIVRNGVKYNINLHLLFTIACLALLVSTSYLLSTLFVKKLFSFLILLSLFLTISIFMNGRIIIAFIAINLILWLTNYCKFNFEKLSHSTIFGIVLFTSFLFSNVSSGVNITLLAFFMLYLIINRHILKSKLLSLLILACIIFQVIWVVSGLQKNISYFGDGPIAIINMLQHGLGRFINTYVIVVILPFIYLAMKTYRKLTSACTANTNYIGCIIFTLGGLWGTSVLFCSIPFVIFLSVKKFNTLIT